MFGKASLVKIILLIIFLCPDFVPSIAIVSADGNSSPFKNGLKHFKGFF
jgi:hypothetical protein